MTYRTLLVAAVLAVSATTLVSAQGVAAQDDGGYGDGAAGSDGRGDGVEVSPGGEADPEVTGAAVTPPVINGGFETGAFTGWTTMNAGDGGASIYSGAIICPEGGDAALPAPSGTYGACIGQFGGGNHVLYQDLTLGTSDACLLKFDHWYANSSTDWIEGPLDYLGPSVQIYRVDLVDPTAGPFSVAPEDVLLEVFKPASGDPLTAGAGFVPVVVDMAAYRGQTVRLRFAESDNQFYNTAAVDNVRLECAGPPAPPTNLVVAVPAATEGDTLTVSWKTPVSNPIDPIVGYSLAADGQETVVAAGGEVSAAAIKTATLTGVDRSVAQTATVTAITAAGQTSFALVVAKALQSRIYVANQIASGPAEYSFLFGTPASQIISGDWDGDGADGFGSRVGNVYTLVDQRGNPFKTIGYGKSSDTTLVGDWNANGTDTLAARRGNIYYLKNTIAPGNADVVLGYGQAGDEVFVGDWNGNGQDTFAVRRGNTFYVRNSTTTGVADIVFGYGIAGDEVLVGDWNQDGIDTFAVRRGNLIFIRNDFQPGPAQTVIGYGKPSDQLLVGDWNNDGVDTFSVRRLEPTP